jgi:hypothetical protein
MAMQEGYATPARYCLLKGAIEIIGVEGGIAMNVAVVTFRQENTLEESSQPRAATTRVPDREAEVFLAIWSDEVGAQKFIHLFRHRHGIDHVVSNRRSMKAR